MNHRPRPRLLWLLLLVLAVPMAQAGVWPQPRTASALLPVDEAFHFLGAQRDANGVALRWQIAPGYYLYRKRIEAHVTAPAGAKLKPPQLPPAVRKQEPGVGEVAVYRGSLTVRLTEAAGSPPARRVRVRYQGCADRGVCYPPQTREVAVVDDSR